jgi:selenocysteine lyase/cysteine desulfurase
VVIDAISKYYQEINANIHRGVHIEPISNWCVWDFTW